VLMLIGGNLLTITSAHYAKTSLAPSHRGGSDFLLTGRKRRESGIVVARVELGAVSLIQPLVLISYLSRHPDGQVFLSLLSGFF